MSWLSASFQRGTHEGRFTGIWTGQRRNILPVATGNIKTYPNSVLKDKYEEK